MNMALRYRTSQGRWMTKQWQTLLAVIVVGAVAGPAAADGLHAKPPRQNGPVTVTGVGGARVGMSVRRVEILWHTRLRPTVGSLPNVACQTFEPVRRGAKPHLTFRQGRLVSIWYFLPIFRNVKTGLGLGLDASPARVRALYRTNLVWHPLPLEDGPDSGDFTVTKTRPDVGLKFTMHSGKLTYITYGRFANGSCED